LTTRQPTSEEEQDVAYGRQVAAALTAWDIGQTVVVAGQACVAVEAMEGTDATIARAGALLGTLEDGGEASTLARRLTVVKVAKPRQDMRFDVPVIGLRTIQTMRQAGATCLSLEAGRTLIFDLPAVLEAAAVADIAIVAHSAD
jgi:UDP-2,3-diacylglucosamine hydrolase